MNRILYSFRGEYKPTAMRAKIKKRVGEWRDKIIQERLAPWWTVGTGKPLRVTTHSGQVIQSQSEKFEGTIRKLFWSRDFIPPFLEDAIETVLEEVAGICRVYNLPPEDYLTEAAGYLTGMVCTIYNRMAEIDARLRRERDYRDVSKDIDGIVGRIKDYVDAARLLAGQAKEPDGRGRARQEGDIGHEPFGFKAGAERIRQAKFQEITPAGEPGDTAPYVEIDLAARTLTIDQKRIAPSDRVWEFLKELAAATQHDLPDLKPADWKNAVNMLRDKIGREDLRLVVEFTQHGYKLAQNVKLKGGGQVGIRKTKQGR